MKISILGVVSLILGAVGMYLSFIYIGSFLCLISLILGVISLYKGETYYKWPSVCGIVCSAVGVLITLALAINFYKDNPDAIFKNKRGSATKTVSTNAESNDNESGGSFELEKNIFSVELTIPADFTESHTQAEWDNISDEMGYKSITLNPDGSVTYKMTKKQHEEIIEETRNSINSALQEMIGSEEYPNLTNISTNNDFTEFTVTTTSEELNLAESLSTLVFYLYGGMYNAFSGNAVDNISVTFINANTGSVISQANSKDMGSGDSVNDEDNFVYDTSSIKVL